MAVSYRCLMYCLLLVLTRDPFCQPTMCQKCSIAFLTPESLINIVTGPIPKLAASKRKRPATQSTPKPCKLVRILCRPFMLGFEAQDAVALLRLNELFIESFHVADVKILRGNHLPQSIGRVAGQDGKTRFASENAARTRTGICQSTHHLLGSYTNLRVARNVSFVI
jgi:hypothetical protein